MKKKKTKIQYYVGKKKINYSLKEKNILKLINQRQFISKLFGRFISYSVDTEYLFGKLKSLIAKNEDYLIKG